MQPFIYEALPARVVFGSGAVAELKLEAERLGVRRVLVLSTPGRGEAQAREIAALLGDLAVGIHAGAVMHTRVEATEKALQLVRKLRRAGSARRAPTLADAQTDLPEGADEGIAHPPMVGDRSIN
jgi:Iron-containing alcohol dehydrogenase